jgi:predicted metalloendopeptidase
MDEVLMMRRHLMGLLCLVFIAACGDTERSEDKALGFDRANMDESVSPREDFFRHVNGGWLARTDIPEDRARWGAFDELNKTAEDSLREIVREISVRQGIEQGSPDQMIRDLYLSFMDEDGINDLDIAALDELRAAIDAIDADADLAVEMVRLQRHGLSAPFAFFVTQDAQDSQRYLGHLSQSGLGLPDRDYYLNDGGDARELREAYAVHVERMLEMAGLEAPAEAAERILGLETRLAAEQWTRVENRDRVATYNLMSLRRLGAIAPGVDWSAYFTAAGAGGADEVVVRQPSYLGAAVKVLDEVPLDTWKEYLHWHALRTYAPMMSERFADAHFDFHGRRMQGLEAQRPREERAIQAINSIIGFQLGKVYVERHFREESRERMAELVENMKAAFEIAIDEAVWMSEETREEARVKLGSFNTKIGFPEKWREYEGLEIRADDLVGNVMRSRAFEYGRMMDRLGRPVDTDEWFMTPQTVNAYYSPSFNEIVFPAAILQPPFFNVDADDAVNYGAIGAVIGHEISHGFDDQGRRMDADGNLRDWWSDESEEEFTRRAERLIEQYSSYQPLDGVNINGRLTLGENIADHGGMRVAWAAYRLSLNGEEPPVIGGYSGAQRFFKGWAQIWRIKFRDEALRQHLQTRPHSPGEFRTNGVLRNMDEFHEAFGTSPGDAMWRDPEDRVRIW